MRRIPVAPSAAPPASTDFVDTAPGDTDSGMDCNGKPLDLSRPCVMGILNITPDSFSDGGFFIDRHRAQDHARAMVEAGAAIIDIGGESTRPGAAAVSEQQELDRVIPVIEALAELPVPLSIDTSKPGVMRAAVAAGAGLINDVRALREAGALDAAAGLKVPVCLMHMLGQPRTMQQDPQYRDVVADVRAFLAERRDACIAAGIDAASILLDPGFGFGKTPAQNLRLIRELPDLATLGCPLLVGVSRKSTIGAILDDRPVDGRLAGSLALAALALQGGAKVIRAHDVAETVDLVRVLNAAMVC